MKPSSTETMVSILGNGDGDGDVEIADETGRPRNNVCPMQNQVSSEVPPPRLKEGREHLQDTVLQEQEQQSTTLHPSNASSGDIVLEAKIASATSTTTPISTNNKLQGTTLEQRRSTTQQSPNAFSVADTTDSPNLEASCRSRIRLSGKELRRKNRRRLRRLLKNPSILPSFVRVIGGRNTTNTEPKTGVTTSNAGKNDAASGDDSDEDILLEPPNFVIDVDEYLGLKKNKKFAEVMRLASRFGSTRVDASTSQKNNLLMSAPSAAVTSTSAARGSIATNNDSKTDWYEGTRPMAMIPDDTIYLSENQQCIRKQLEFFSATADDCSKTAGRRGTMVLGRIGFRCVNCAKAFRNGKCPRMMPGSVSFPVDFTSLYNLAIQKQQVHLDNCPFIPSNMKWKNIRYASKGSTTGGNTSRPRKRMKMGIPSLTYWHIACRRLGLVELKNKTGLRFGRDLKLDALPFEKIRIEVEQEQPTLFPKQRQIKVEEVATPVRVLSTNHVGTIDPTGAADTASTLNIPKAVADILEQAKREGENPSIQTQFVSKDDASVLSDFVFLTIKQATLCHAAKEDFATRGKKTKLMRLGYAGFCCRHCKLNYYSAAPVFQNSCRSFSSSSYNLGSAMSNSFMLHLMKCSYTPQSIKHALQSLKKVHAKQMQRLPYGSQSRIFLKIWNQIRAADKPIEAGVDGVTQIDSLVSTKKEKDEEYLPDTIRSSKRKNKSVRSPSWASSRLRKDKNAKEESISKMIVPNQQKETNFVVRFNEMISRPNFLGYLENEPRSKKRLDTQFPPETNPVVRFNEIINKPNFLGYLENEPRSKKRLDTQFPPENKALLVEQSKLKVDQGGTVRSKSNLSIMTGINNADDRMLLVNKTFSGDRGEDIMDNIESGQFDDA